MRLQAGTRVPVGEVDLDHGVRHVYICPRPDSVLQYSTGRHHEELVQKSTRAVRTNAPQAEDSHHQNASGGLLRSHLHHDPRQHRLFSQREIPSRRLQLFYRQYIR